MEIHLATATALKPSIPKQLLPPSDFFQFAETLSADELATLKQVRAFMETKVTPVINKCWVEDAFPFEVWDSACVRRFQEETMKWTTPRIVAMAVGLEINAYACAELN